MLQRKRCEGQRHSMVLIGIDALFVRWCAALAIPIEFAVVGIVNHVAQLLHLTLQGFNAVGLLDFQGGQALEVEGDIECGTGHHEGLRQVGSIHKVILQL